MAKQGDEASWCLLRLLHSHIFDVEVARKHLKNLLDCKDVCVCAAECKIVRNGFKTTVYQVLVEGDGQGEKGIKCSSSTW